MTQLTSRWIRGVAVVLNALMLVRNLYGLVYLLRIVLNPRVTSNMSGQLVWMSLAVLASVLAIVAILWMNRTADSQMAVAIPH